MTWNGAGGWVIFSHDAAGELFPHGLDHFPLPRHHLQRLGDRLAELGEPAAAARAGGRAGDHHALARQVRRKRCPHRLAAGERMHRRAVGRRGGGLVFGRAGRRFLELQFQLIEQLAAALGGLAVLLAPQLGDLQLVIGDQRFGAGGARLGLLPRRRARRPAAARQRRRSLRDVVTSRIVARRQAVSPRTPSELSQMAAGLIPPLPAAKCEPGSASQFRQACRPAAPR